MPTEIIWTCLPTGRGRTSLFLSVHVTPRLTAAVDSALGDFPEFVTWPPDGLTLDVVINGVTYTGADVTWRSAPDKAVWSALFPPTTYVRPHTVNDPSGLLIETLPLGKIHDFLRDVYADAMLTSPTEHLSIDQLLANGFDEIGFHGPQAVDRWNGARNQMLTMLAADHAIDTRAPSSTTFDFVQLAEFYAGVDAKDPGVAAVYEEPVRQPRLDFHAAVQFVNQHPALMRLLGLTIDLEVNVPPAAVLGPVTVEVKPDAAALASSIQRTPVTHAEVTQQWFHAVPRPGTTHLAPGWMRLDDPSQFEVLTLDTDGAGLKAINFAGTLQTRKLHPTEDSLHTAGLPSLRHDGFCVIRHGKAKELQATFVHAPTNEVALANDALELYLDDLVRGVRVDVWDSASDRWHSVMARTGEYQLLGQTMLLPVTDEGILGTTASKKVKSDELCVSEEVFWWDGWSLVVPRPGKALTTDPDADPPLIERPPNDPGPDIDARIHFDVVPGSLPRLRFGRDYRFRARLVDLAGNSRPPDDRTELYATAPVRFGRFEPASAPPVLYRVPKGPGESAETVVLRSTLNMPADPPTSERHVVPNKVGQLTVELHGMVDDDPDDGAVYDMLDLMDAAMVADHYDVDQVETTWAPDPLPSGFAFKLLDGPNAGHLQLPKFDTWPAHRAVRLVVVEGADPPAYDEADRVLKVPLEPGEIVHARLSSWLPPSMLAQHGLWSWALGKLPPGPQGDQLRVELEQHVASGQACMLEPYRVLTLMHAVRQPLASPEFPGGLGVTREELWTHVVLTRTLQLHRHSTGRVDILASWTDPIDTGATGPSTFTVVDQTACSIPIVYDGPSLLQLHHRHELGDTKHRWVTYRGVATSRFVEQFTSTTTFAFPGAGSVVTPLDTGTPPLGVVPGSLKLKSVTGSGDPLVLVEGRQFTVDAPTATITFGDDPADLPDPGTAVDAVFVVPPVTRETEPPPAGSGVQLVNVRSSARPAAPKIRSILPTFGWEQADLTEGGELVGRTSTRRGAGLRVYLERPWWSSGEGEQLAVVLWPEDETADPEAPIAPDPKNQLDDDPRRPFVTMWGQDPIYASRALPNRHPRRSSFPNAVEPISTDVGLTLAELGANPDLPVSVAGHTVTFDTERELWSCDITLEAGAAYSPMIRLALARWQPDSLSRMELSPVVLADVVRLAPDRFASVLFSDDDDSLVEVELTGPTHIRTAVSFGSDPGTAWVTVEQATGAIGGELGWEPVGDPVELNAGLLNGIGTWTGQVQLPGPRGAATYRLVVEQFERLAAEPMTKPPPNPNYPTSTIPIPTPRLVHTDVIPL